MPSKISGLSGDAAAAIGASRAAEKTRDPVTGGSSAPAESSSGSGDLHITDSASQLASLEHAVRNLPAVDPVRVAQFQWAIEQGTYTVQPQHVADQLMQLEQAFKQLQDG
ncbi:MAG TPA: flagellar biosynthesis anti-sigma factor FlgM [Steroidobacteraceae bacterium]|jgi:flagellar biosynthesis anti-sigma factor FlgM